MPRVKLDPEYKNKRFRESIYGKLKRLDMTQSELADDFGISKQAMGMKIRKLQFTWKELQTLFKVLDYTDEEILQYMHK